MSDDITLPGTGSVVATDEISSKHYQIIKLAIGADGSLDGIVSASAPLPVKTTPKYLSLTLTASDPTPTNTDITNAAGGDIVAGDLAIRDTSNHYFLIPMAGYNRISLGFDTVGNAFDQDIRFIIYGGFTSNKAFARLLDVTLTSGSAIRWGVSQHDVGEGGYSGTSNPSDVRNYEVPSLGDYEIVTLWIIPSAAPATGEFELSIFRS